MTSLSKPSANARTVDRRQRIPESFQKAAKAVPVKTSAGAVRSRSSSIWFGQSKLQAEPSGSVERKINMTCDPTKTFAEQRVPPWERAGLAPARGCLSCSDYEDRLEEIRMALVTVQPKSNPYARETIEFGIFDLRQTLEYLRKQNKHDRKQWKCEVRGLRRALEKKTRDNKAS